MQIESIDERHVTTETLSPVYWVAIKADADESSYSDESLMFRGASLEEVTRWVEKRMSTATEGVARIHVLIPGGDPALRAAGEEMHGIELAIVPASGTR